jgi:hypothetical protein
MARAVAKGDLVRLSQMASVEVPVPVGAFWATPWMRFFMHRDRSINDNYDV